MNKKYAVCMVALIISGITYNVQFDWVIVFEMILAISIKMNYDFFGNEKGNQRLKVDEY